LAERPLLIVDNSNHRRAASWFEDCLAGVAPSASVVREDLRPEPGPWRAVILTGSEHSIFEEADWIKTQLAFVRRLAVAEVPLLGVCFGHQLIFRALYGKEVLARRAVPEVGWYAVASEPDGLFAGVTSPIFPYNFHFDQVIAAPPPWLVVASSDACPIQAVKHRTRPWFGLQFHPEVKPADGADGISRERELLAGYGLDADGIVSGGAARARNYPEIVRNFAGLAHGDAGR